MKKCNFLLLIAITVLALFGFTNVKAEEVDYSKLDYTKLTKGNATADVSKYSYHFIKKPETPANVEAQLIPDGYTHKPESSTVSRTDKNSIYFSLPKAPVTSVEINNEEVDYYTNGGALAYVPLDLFKNEYNVTTFYSNAETMEIVVIKNENVTEARTKAESDLEDILPEGASDAVKALVDQAKADLKNAQNIDEINDIVNALPKKISLQQAKEKATADLKAAVGNNNSSKVKEIYNKALENINKATTEEEVTKILEAAKKEISNQIQAENKKSVKNPVTIDNVFIYLLILGGSIAIISYFYQKAKVIKM